MDLLEASVYDILKWKYPDGFTEEIIATILSQALNGLAFLHEKGIIHRDIKCANFLIDSNGNINITDFGVSVVLSHDQKAYSVTGTWNWMAPEVLDSSKHGGYNNKADIWSIGITTIEMAYGVQPYLNLKEHDMIIHILNHPPPNLVEPYINKEKKIFQTNFIYLFDLVSIKCQTVDQKQKFY